MIKIFFLSSFIFIGLFYSFENVLSSLIHYDLWKIDIKNESQRRIFKIMQNLTDHKTSQNVYVFGGSGSREFFKNDVFMSNKLGKNFYNCAVSSETPFDSLKLQILLTEGDTLIYGVHPKSFYDNEYNEKQLIDGYYYGGAYYKYPLRFNKDDFPFIQINDKNIAMIDRISPIINTYMYLVKTYSLKTIFLSERNNILPIQYHYKEPRLSTLKLTSKLNKYFLKNKDTKFQNLSLNFTILESMIQLAEEKKVKFILMELPLSPIIKESFKDDLPLYYKKLSTLLRKYPHVKFISNSMMKTSKQYLFYDSIHLLNRGRNYYSDDVIRLLKRDI